MGKILPVLLAIIGFGAGAGAGYMLRPPPAPEPAADTHPDTADAEGSSAGHGAETAPDGHGGDDAAAAGEPEYVKLNNQFVVPVVDDNHVESLIILSISLEVAPGSTEAVFQKEPKLRDAFLQVLFDHANAGGFRGAFTRASSMEALRNGLLEIARRTMGATVRDVLITDIVRQDA
ncbi:flagellar basal body-associated FliL family protein [Albidovulum sp.]